jgi:hypothetical protein
MKDNIYQHLYNGKEKQDDVLGGVNLDWYDLGQFTLIPSVLFYLNNYQNYQTKILVNFFTFTAQTD